MVFTNKIANENPKIQTPGGTVGHQCLNEENVHYTVLTPDVPTGSDPSPVGRYREPSVLPDGRILVSYAGGPVNDMNELSATPPDFGIYIYDLTTGQNQLVYNDRTTWDLNALPVVPRAEPPVAWSTPVHGLSDEDFGRICPWLAANVDLGGGDAATCDDGRTVEPYTYECDPAHSGRSARSLPCSTRCRSSRRSPT